jgi:hypothetical protein
MFELFGVATAQDDVFWLKGSGKTLHDVGDLSPPFFLAQTLHPCSPDIVLERLTLPIGKVTEFHWLKNAVDDHGGAQTCPKPQKEHSPPL